MKTQAFPWIALSLGLLVMTVMLGSGALRPAEEYALPLLTMMIVNEFGFFLCAIGAAVGVKSIVNDGFRASLLVTVIGCTVLAAGFAWLGVLMWPDGVFDG